MAITTTMQPTPSVTPTDGPTTEDPIQEHLAVIIGVPTGVGLSLLGLGLCVLWLACSSYCEYRRANKPVIGVGSGTRSTGLPQTKTGTLPQPVPLQSMSNGGEASHALRTYPDEPSVIAPESDVLEREEEGSEGEKDPHKQATPPDSEKVSTGTEEGPGAVSNVVVQEGGGGH